MAAAKKIGYAEALQRYDAAGLSDYRLKTAFDILTVHGHDIAQLKGYKDLTAEQRNLFNAFIVNYYNGVGMGMRCGFVPKSVHYVEKITYCVSRPADDWHEQPYKEVVAVFFNILLPNGKKKKFKEHIIYPEIPPEYWFEQTKEEFLRYDYKDGKRMDWLHVIEPRKWY